MKIEMRDNKRERWGEVWVEEREGRMGLGEKKRRNGLKGSECVHTSV